MDRTTGGHPDPLISLFGSGAGSVREGIQTLKEGVRDLLDLVRSRQSLPPGRPPGSAGTTTRPTSTVGLNTPPTAGQVEEARSQVQVGHTQQPVISHGASEMNRIVPANTPGKIQNFKELVAAERELARSTAAERAAQAAVETARNRHAAGPTPRTAAALAFAENRLAGATQQRTRDEAKVTRERTELRGALRAKAPEQAAAIDRLNLEARTVTRDNYTVQVGSASVNLHNAVDSYATVDDRGLTGSAGGDGAAAVTAAIDRSDFSASAKRLLKGTSANEGTFTSINGYDSKGITFGFIQMAVGRSGDTFSNLLAAFKEDHPQVSAETLQRYGIDVERGPKGAELVIRQPDGQVLRGEAAARKLGSDPTLAAALSASGLHPDMQQTQLQFAKDYLDRQRKQTIDVNGQPVRIADLITSEYGNGVLFDRSVHGGMAGARATLDRVATAYLAAHPGASLADESVRAAVETAYIQAIEGTDGLAGRCANIQARTSSQRGSYVD